MIPPTTWNSVSLSVGCWEGQPGRLVGIIEDFVWPTRELSVLELKGRFNTSDLVEGCVRNFSIQRETEHPLDDRGTVGGWSYLRYPATLTRIVLGADGLATELTLERYS